MLLITRRFYVHLTTTVIIIICYKRSPTKLQNKVLNFQPWKLSFFHYSPTATFSVFLVSTLDHARNKNRWIRWNDSFLDIFLHVQNENSGPSVNSFFFYAEAGAKESHMFSAAFSVQCVEWRLLFFVFFLLLKKTQIFTKQHTSHNLRHHIIVTSYPCKKR